MHARVPVVMSARGACRGSLACDVATAGGRVASCPVDRVALTDPARAAFDVPRGGAACGGWTSDTHAPGHSEVLTPHGPTPRLLRAVQAHLLMLPLSILTEQLRVPVCAGGDWRLVVLARGCVCP